jgi:hypothetical protein
MPEGVRALRIEDWGKPLLGFHMTSMPPTKVSTMPSPRLQPICSPSMATESSVVITSPSWPTMAALDGLALLIPMKNSAKPPLIRKPTTMRHVGHGQQPRLGHEAHDAEADRRTKQRRDCHAQHHEIADDRVRCPQEADEHH